MRVLLKPVIKVCVAVSTMALLLGELYTVLPSATVIDVKLLQQEKGLDPIDVTLAGISTEVRPTQLLKTRCPKVVKELGNSIALRL